MSQIGNVSVYFAFFLSLYTVASALIGVRFRNRDLVESSRNSAVSILILLFIACASLVYELTHLNFSLRYVALNASTDLPMIYRFTALWAGQAGSLLLWCFVLSIYAAIVVIISNKRDLSFNPYVTAVMFSVLTFFLYLITFVENPFAKLPFIPEEGRGLNPILQNGYMAIHPVTLYVGYVGLTIPFAFGMAALLSGRLDDMWIRNSRRWALFAWTFLSVGLILGARWAYLELGWGGYWAWDPVENAAFMPWLAATAFLHSVMIQERKGMLKKWNMILLIITFFLTLFGTFITRSGIISSVHSFAQSDIGPLFLGFIAFVLIFSFGILTYRLKELESEENFDSILSRESAFIFNNLLFLGAAFTVFFGTLFPIISEAIAGEKILVGPPYFNKVNVPIGLVLIFLMGIGPLISWRKSSADSLRKNFLIPFLTGLLVSVILFILNIRDVVALITFGICGFVVSTIVFEFYKGISVRMTRNENIFTAFTTLISRNKRRYGGYIIHLGVVLIVIGITSSSTFNTENEININKGEKVKVGKYDLQFLELEKYNNDAKFGTRAVLALSYGNNKTENIYPEKNIYKYEGNREINQETEVALRSTLTDDLYVILSNVGSDDNITLRVFINPMVSWIWAGGIVVLFGAVITMWPGFKRKEALGFEKQDSMVKHGT
ncbi:MAG: heme lyase CcmF/NrfE family subunit [Thermodesulfobacteriota bacterium]